MKKRWGRLPRGQVATENLILYTAVILLIAVGLIAVWQSGALMPQVHKRGFIGFSQIVPTDWVVSTENKVALSLKSEADAPVILPIGSITFQVNRVQCPPGPSTDVTIQPGQKYIVIMDCPGIGEAHDLGEEFEMDVKASYRNTVSGQTHDSVGKVYGFVENLGDFSTTTSTSTTTTLEKKCKNVECDEPGVRDIDNCSEIVYGQPPMKRKCEYCPINLNLFPDGKRRCWPNGNCGQLCDGSYECIDPDPSHDNICDACIDGICKEGPTQCGQCPSWAAGTIDPLNCPIAECDYCYPWFDLRSDTTQYDCADREDCGDACTIPGDSCLGCEDRCPRCDPNPAVPGTYMCVQGDCDKRCGHPGDPECELGCPWCNMATYKCEKGDCCKPCTLGGNECQLGCDVCENGFCQHNIAVMITAYNNTPPSELGKIVDIDQSIYLTVEGQISGGKEIGRLLVSDGTWMWETGFPFLTCQYGGDLWTLVQNHHQSEIAANGNTIDPLTDPWYTTNGQADIVWREYYTSCPNTGTPTTDCKNIWTTSEDAVGRYCYFALAQRKTQTGDGEWSQIAVDYIDVGYINVTLVYPIDGSGGT